LYWLEGELSRGFFNACLRGFLKNKKPDAEASFEAHLMLLDVNIGQYKEIDPLLAMEFEIVLKSGVFLKDFSLNTLQVCHLVLNHPRLTEKYRGIPNLW
jgi:hypothetical protein